jgi:hypothetical protein
MSPTSTSLSGSDPSVLPLYHIKASANRIKSHSQLALTLNTGSRWDKVLIRALYFAEQLHNFEQAVQSFALDSSAAAAIGYGHAQLLLEVRGMSLALSASYEGGIENCYAAHLLTFIS